MESKELLSTLESLKRNLSEIDSAKQQVEQTVAASAKLKTAISGNVESISRLIGEIQQWQTEIKETQKSNIADFQSSVSHLKSSCDNAVSAFGHDINKVSDNFSNQTGASLSAFDQELEKFAEQIKQLESIREAIITVSDEISKIKETITALDSNMQSANLAQSQNLDKICNKLESLTQIFTTAINTQARNLNTTYNDTVVRIDTVSTELSNLKKNFDKIFLEIGTINNNLHELKTVNSSLSTMRNQVDSLFNKVYKETTSNLSTIQKQVDSLSSNINTNRGIIVAGFVILILLQIFV